MKSKKATIFSFFLIALFFLFLYLYFSPHNYYKKYYINKYQIEESYDKESKLYLFNVKYNEIDFSFAINNKYLNKRSLINDIVLKEKGNAFCILPVSHDMNIYPLCSNGDVIVYDLSNLNYEEFNYDKYESINKEYNSSSINYLNGKSYLLFNYRGFYFLSNDSYKNIELFSKDEYSLNLFYQYNNYLIVPDYDDNYFFNKLYVINMLNGRKDEIRIEKGISFDSIFLGDYQNKVYLLDKKEEKEYLIDIKNLKISETEIQILKNNKLVKTNVKDIINNNLYFERKADARNYEIVDDSLYEVINNNYIKIKENVNSIVKADNGTVYYTEKDNLYMFNHFTGNILLIHNFEWNFNSTNMIFISK